MKKLMSIILALVMVMSLSVVAFAAETGDTIVQASVPESFVWEVPADVTLVQSGAYNHYIGGNDVSFSNVLLKEGNYIWLTASSNNGWTIGGNDYSLSIEGSTPESGVCFNSDASLSFGAEMTADHAFDLTTDTVTFKAEIVS